MPTAEKRRSLSIDDLAVRRHQNGAVLLASSPPSSTAFDLVLILHIGVVIVAVVTLGASYGAARSLSSAVAGSPWPAPAARYFTPGPDIAGRTLYLIPVSGGALVGMSQHAYDFGDTFIWLGLVLWLVAAGGAEHLVFASSSRLRAHLADREVADEGAWRTDAAKIRRGVEVVVVVILVSVVLMVAQP